MYLIGSHIIFLSPARDAILEDHGTLLIWGLAGGRKPMGSSRFLALGVSLFLLSGSCAPGGKRLSLAVIITEICYNEPRNMEPRLLD